MAGPADDAAIAAWIRRSTGSGDRFKKLQDRRQSVRSDQDD